MVMGELSQEAEVLIIGAGPGGYAAAFRAADLGLDVTLVEKDKRPGGECLHRGCIPSKTLLYLAELLHDAGRAGSMGIAFEAPKVDLDGVRKWKNQVIDTLASGLETLCERRGIQRIKGQAVFEGPESVRLRDSEITHIKFKHAIVATGSGSTPLKGIEMKPGGRIMDSSDALDLPDVPKSLLVVGAGYVALEMGMVYAALGSRVTVAVHRERILRGADADLVEPLFRRLKEVFEAVHFHTTLESVKETAKKVKVQFRGEGSPGTMEFDRVLLAVGRQPSSQGLGLENTKVKVNDKGYIVVDEQMRTTDERIFAVGDVAGPPLLAHKAFREGKVAAEVIAGKPSAFDPRAIPGVVYTDPQVAWCGMTEEEARARKRAVRVGRFPWKFSGRAVTMDATNGLTKLVVDPETGRVLGVGVVGRNAEGLISEGALAVEMAALAEDVALTIHPHPTLSETMGEAAEIFMGGGTHIMPKKGSPL
jgi:dihydrolipoamide dehydrogenase